MGYVARNIARSDFGPLGLLTGCARRRVGVGVAAQKEPSVGERCPCKVAGENFIRRTLSNDQLQSQGLAGDAPCYISQAGDDEPPSDGPALIPRPRVGPRAPKSSSCVVEIGLTRALLERALSRLVYG